MKVIPLLFITSFLSLYLSGSILAQTPGPGFTASATPLTNCQCLEVVAAGSYYFFDGVSIQHTTGRTTRKIFTPATTVFGSFIKKVPGKQAILFGESSKGTITEIGTGALPYFRTVATVNFNFDCAYGPGNELLVSAPAATPGNNAVYLIDRNGKTDELLQVPGASGPIAFLPGGDLLVGITSAAWPPPANSASIYRFAKTMWRRAIGPGSLTSRDGTVVIGKLNGVYDLAVDGRGEIYFSDSTSKVIYGYLHGRLVTIYTNGKLTPVQIGFVPGNGPSVFYPWQPGSGGTLLAYATDFISTTNLLRISPKRPSFASTTNPLPAKTNFSATLSNGPSNGFSLLLMATNGARKETGYLLPGLPFPLFISLDLQQLVFTIPLTLDATGGTKFNCYWPGGINGKVYMQPILLAGAALAGTATGITLTLQR